MKYKIVELNNGRYQVFFKSSIFSSWFECGGDFESVSEASGFITRLKTEKSKRNDIKEGKKTKKIVEIGTINKDYGNILEG